MERLLIIGGSGLLGQRLVELGKENFDVFSTYKEHALRGENCFQLDVTNRANVIKTVQKIKPDIIIDTHYLSNVDYCETHPEDAWSINVDGTKNVAEIARTLSCKYVFISSDYVYDGDKTTSYSEKDKPHPVNYYGKTKLIAEKIIEALDMDFIIARTAVMFGPHKGDINRKMPFPTWLVQELKQNKEVTVVVDQYNNPTHTDSLVEFLFALLNKDRGGVFNVTGRDNLSRYDFAVKIADVFGLNKNLIKPITTPELNQPARRPKKLALDISKVERATNITGLSIDDALKRLRGVK